MVIGRTAKSTVCKEVKAGSQILPCKTKRFHSVLQKLHKTNAEKHSVLMLDTSSPWSILPAEHPMLLHDQKPMATGQKKPNSCGKEFRSSTIDIGNIELNEP